VQITVKAIDRSNRIRVTTNEVNYGTTYAKIEQDIQRLTLEMDNMGNDLPGCTIEHDGKLYHEMGCDVEDDRGSSLCLVERRLHLRRQLESMKMEEWQLKNCWQSSLVQGTHELLWDTDLIHSYRSVRQLCHSTWG
jgi:hypothetical protein